MIRLLLLAPLLVSAPSFAQETRATATAKFSAEFAATDADKDGALTRAEVAARMGRMRAGAKKMDPVNVKRLTDLWFGRADANGNGRVTEPEAQALLAQVFRRYDANGDGRIGGDEQAAARARLKAGR